MSTSGKGTYLINSDWASGALVFFEKAVGRTATGDIFTLSTSAVKVGGTSQDVDFQVYGAGSVSAIIDIGAATFTLVGIATATNGAMTITNATATSSTTTGALIVTGGIATAADVFVGDDLFFASGAVINWNASDVTMTHAAGKLTIALPAPTSSIDGFTVNMAAGSTTPGTIHGIVSTLTTFATAQTSGTQCAIRGHLVTGNSVADSYLYGVQGKLTLGSSDVLTGGSFHYCAVMAQMDLTNGTTTSGHTACLVCSIQDSSSTVRPVQGIYIELPTYGSGASMNAFVQGNGSASYALDFLSGNTDYLVGVPLAATGKSPYSANSTHTSASTAKVGALAIKVGTDTRYVYVFSDAGS